MTYHIPLLIAAIGLGWAAWVLVYKEEVGERLKKIRQWFENIPIQYLSASILLVGIVQAILMLVKN